MKIGNLDISAFKVGGSDCSIYLGDVKLYPTGSTDYSQQYLTFVAKESGTFKLSGNTVSYSLDSGSTWSSLASNNNSPTVSAGSKIIWKATLTPTSTKGVGRFSSTGQFDVEGNAMSLLYGDNFQNQTSLNGKNYAFRRLFSGCTTVASAENMSLPATTLATSCYNGMFQGCTSLTTAPALPATTLAQECYQGMFSGCASLVAAPQLPATTLKNSCYRAMFQRCSSLATVQTILPATTLADYCYYNMFYGCASLTTAPELPATTLANTCYNNMFRYCTRLKYIKCLATNITASDCTLSWVDGVASSGTFVKAASMTSWTTGGNGVPNNWTVQNA